jgi:CheY-like chemotaxis protein
MPNILIVDDSGIDRALAGGLLEREEDIVISYATNGREALDQISTMRPDLVVSDLQMPEMSGLELVATLREEHPSVPVIIMTALGSEKIAAEALKIGASGYVPKASLSSHLPQAVRRLFNASKADRRHSRLFHSLQDIDCRFRLQNDPELISPLVDQIQGVLRCLPLGDEAERVRVGVAVGHGLWIAHHHGNLELALNGEWSDANFQEEAIERRMKSPATERSIEFHVVIDREQATFDIRHEGAGIDVSQLPNDLESKAADRSWLSGFLVIPAIMDDVSYSPDDGRIVLLKRAVQSSDDELEVS